MKRGKEEVELFSIRDAAALLGVSRGTLAALVHQGEIRTVLIGAQRRIPLWALREWQERTAA